MAGRPEKALDPRDPAQAFAQRLRDLRDRSGRPTYIQMAGRSHYSAATLSEAARGNTVPSWDVTAAYVRACGGDPEQWRASWERARDRGTGQGEPPGSSRTPRPAAWTEEIAAPAGSAAVAEPTSAAAGRDPEPPGASGRWARLASGRWGWMVLVAGVLGAVLLGNALVEGDSGRAGGAPAPPPGASIAPAATFLRPTAGEAVADVTETRVQFTVRGVPASDSLWCLVKNEDDRWFPYPVQGPLGGRWQSLVGVGPARPREDLVLEIHVVRATPDADAGIKDAVERSSPEWTGLDDLPPGATSIGSVTITRKR